MMVFPCAAESSELIRDSLTIKQENTLLKLLNLVKVRGLTVIETMVAVAVIAILAFVVYPSYQSYLSGARVNNCIQYMQTLTITVDSLVLVNGNDASVLSENDIDDDDSQCNEGVQIQNNKVNGDIDLVAHSVITDLPGNRLKILMRRTGNKATWTCFSNLSDTRYRSELCALPLP